MSFLVYVWEKRDGDIPTFVWETIKKIQVDFAAFSEEEISAALYFIKQAALDGVEVERLCLEGDTLTDEQSDASKQCKKIA